MEALLRRAELDRADRMKRWIDQRTWGRVQDIHVEVCDGRMIITGRARTHYARQLVLAAAMESLGQDHHCVEIEVCVEVSRQ